MPAIPAVNDARVKHMVRMNDRLTPARRADSGLPPMAYTYRPNLVRPSRNVHATSTPSTRKTTYGTPWIGEFTPRSVLQMRTTTTPATRTPTILRMVRLTGGATRPLLRRRDSRTHARVP